MNQFSFYVLTMVLGVVLTVHLAMNGQVGSALNNPRVGNALFWCIGALGAVIIGITGWQQDALKPLREVNPILLTAGLMGASLVFGIAWLIPKVGAGPLMIALLAGQIIGGMVLSHFGWLGSPVQPIRVANVFGALLMIGGVLLATYR